MLDTTEREEVRFYIDYIRRSCLSADELNSSARRVPSDPLEVGLDPLGDVWRMPPLDAHGHHGRQPAVEQRRLVREGMVSDAQ